MQLLNLQKENDTQGNKNLSVFIYLSIHPSIYLSIYLCIYTSIKKNQMQDYQDIHFKRLMVLQQSKRKISVLPQGKRLAENVV